MKKTVRCFYNMDANAVELTCNDGSVLTIDCEEVENHPKGPALHGIEDSIVCRCIVIRDTPAISVCYES